MNKVNDYFDPSASDETDRTHSEIDSEPDSEPDDGFRLNLKSLLRNVMMSLTTILMMNLIIKIKTLFQSKRLIWYVNHALLDFYLCQPYLIQH